MPVGLAAGTPEDMRRTQHKRPSYTCVPTPLNPADTSPRRIAEERVPVARAVVERAQAAMEEVALGVAVTGLVATAVGTAEETEEKMEEGGTAEAAARVRSPRTAPSFGRST